MAALPETLGLVGTGTIGASCVRGLCSEGGPKPKFVISPRNAAKAAALAADFPDLVRIAASNQEVVDSADTVIIAVLPKQADEVMGALNFRPEQKVITLMSTVPMPRVKELISPATECAIAMPLPPVAKRKGATLMMPVLPWARAIFDHLGTAVAIDDPEQFKRMQVMTAVMGDFYMRQLTCQEWLQRHDVPKVAASAWVGAIFATIAVDSAQASPDSFRHLIEEQTPGGVNEMVWRGQQADSSYKSLEFSLDQCHARIVSGATDEELAPNKRRKVDA